MGAVRSVFFWAVFCAAGVSVGAASVGPGMTSCVGSADALAAAFGFITIAGAVTDWPAAPSTKRRSPCWLRAARHEMRPEWAPAVTIT